MSKKTIKKCALIPVWAVRRGSLLVTLQDNPQHYSGCVTTMMFNSNVFHTAV